MKFALLLLFTFSVAVAAHAEPLRVLSFNVKVEFDRDETAPAWTERREDSARTVREANADLIGLQECSPGQLTYFQEQLTGYEALGSFPFTSDDPNSPLHLLRNMGITAYTDAVVLYRRALFEPVEEGRWWLSPTPDKISTGFGNFFPRTLFWAKLKHRPTGQEIVVAVTHFDNTEPSQERMAALAHQKLQPFVDTGLPLIFMGDFNTNQHRGDYEKLVSNGWRDSYLVSPEASKDGRDDNVETYPGRGRIDHVFYHGDALKPLSWQILPSPDPARPISDHIPVLVNFEFSARAQEPRE